MEFIFENSSCFFQFPLTTSALRLTVNWKWRRIGWKNVCGAPVGKGRAIQRLSGGDIPTKSWWRSAVGVSFAWKREVQNS
jgi:hypothetical protein